MAIKTAFLTDKTIRALSILAKMRLEELNLIGENPDLIEIYETALYQLARAS